MFTVPGEKKLLLPILAEATLKRWVNRTAEYCVLGMNTPSMKQEYWLFDVNEDH